MTLSTCSSYDQSSESILTARPDNPIIAYFIRENDVPTDCITLIKILVDCFSILYKNSLLPN